MTLILCNILPLKHWLKALKDLGLKLNATRKNIQHMTGMYTYSNSLMPDARFLTMQLFYV